MPLKFLITPVAEFNTNLKIIEQSFTALMNKHLLSGCGATVSFVKLRA